MVKNIFVSKRKKNKKGISILVSYVLLITLAIALSATTYIFLKQYAEKPLPEEGCPEGTNIVIENYSCDMDEKILSITIKNRGLHNVDGVFIKISTDNNREFLEDFWEISSDCQLRSNCINCGRGVCFETNSPNNEFFIEKSFESFEYNQITKIIVIPYKLGEPYATLCENAVASLNVYDCE